MQGISNESEAQALSVLLHRKKKEFKSSLRGECSVPPLHTGRHGDKKETEMNALTKMVLRNTFTGEESRDELDMSS